MKIVRVFPRRTKATPVGDDVFIDAPYLWTEADRVEISVAFTWDLERAEMLESDWKHVAPVFVGGPATNEKGGEFIPGRYLRDGYVITSRGCPNRCWFCQVWRREGEEIRELTVKDGWNILDDNLLSCSEKHIREVFVMLRRQKNRVEFTGGLEAAKLQDWHINELLTLRIKSMFFAYDTPDDYEPLRAAANKLVSAGYSRNILRAYVLCGYPTDTFEKAEKRMNQVKDLSVCPMAMLYRDQNNTQPDPQWRKFQRAWCRPAIIYAKQKEELIGCE